MISKKHTLLLKDLSTHNLTKALFLIANIGKHLLSSNLLSLLRNDAALI